MSKPKVKHITDVLVVQRGLLDGQPFTVNCGAIITLDQKKFDKRVRSLPVCSDCERISAALISTGQANPIPPDRRTVKEILAYTPPVPQVYSFTISHEGKATSWPLAS